ncbi:MAG: hypothetical protein II776_02455 [Clostridia bacterium]|nr:hypothetical protein [Clostridia bacterium]
MKKRILALLLALATVSSLATLFAGAVPYSPPANALKDFGQSQLYLYEVKEGAAAPRADGLVTEADGYGEPIATYSMRYITTAEKVVMKEDNLTPRDEYRMVDAGDRSGSYNVFPTASTPDEVWNSINGIETDNPGAFPYARYYVPTTFSATATYYYYNNGSYSTAYHVTKDTFNDYSVITSRSTKYQVNDWALLTEKPADWETNWKNYFTTSGGAYSALALRSKLSTSTAPVWEPGKYATGTTSAFLTDEPDKWSYDWKNYYKQNDVPTWREGYYFSRSGESGNYTYTILRTQPADWETNFNSYFSRGELIWFPVGGETAPEWQEGKYYSGTPTLAYYYSVQNAKPLYEKPADWERNWKNYFFKLTSASATYFPIISKTAPAFEPGVYFSGNKLKSKLFLSGEGSTGGVASVSYLRTNHVILPEKVNVYARYDNRYLYSAIEVVEADHKDIRYDVEMRYASTLSDSIGCANNSYSFGCNYRRNIGEAPTIVKQGYVRVYMHTNVNLSTAGYQAGVLNKYGNPNATTLQEVNTVGTWFNVKHYTKAQMDQILGKDQPAEQPQDDANSWENTGNEGQSSENTTSFKESGTYGTTVYEYKQLWSVINDKYNGSGSPVPEMFYVLSHISLQNALGQNSCLLGLETPRDTRHLMGSLSRTANGNWPIETYAMRFINRTGLTTGAGFGHFRFQWASISSGYNVFNNDYIITDYASISQKKTFSTSHVDQLWFPAGQEVSDEYAVPYLGGTQIRTDSTEEQGLRFLINIPTGSSKTVAEAGVLIAPTEASRRTQLRLGMDEIRYNSADFATYYGYDFETRKFVNLVTDPDKYFAASATPVDENTFITFDGVGGLPSAIYHVQDLKLDLNNPYAEERKYTTYTVEFKGLLDEDGTYNDWFTFYTIRPYLKYDDGTVVYGEHEYKSVYYVACKTIQQLISTYNTAQTLTTAATRYNMDMMARTAMKNADGTTVTDGNGNTVYTDAETTPSSQSPYFGSINFSLYEDTGEARRDVFRAYATSMFNRANKGYSLRVKEYDNFTDEQKEIIDSYIQRFENIWQCILKCESKVYYYER